MPLSSKEREAATAINVTVPSLGSKSTVAHSASNRPKKAAAGTVGGRSLLGATLWAARLRNEFAKLGANRLMEVVGIRAIKIVDSDQAHNIPKVLL